MYIYTPKAVYCGIPGDKTLIWTGEDRVSREHLAAAEGWEEDFEGKDYIYKDPCGSFWNLKDKDHISVWIPGDEFFCDFESRFIKLYDNMKDKQKCEITRYLIDKVGTFRFKVSKINNCNVRVKVSAEFPDTVYRVLDDWEGNYVFRFLAEAHFQPKMSGVRDDIIIYDVLHGDKNIRRVQKEFSNGMGVTYEETINRVAVKRGYWIVENFDKSKLIAFYSPSSKEDRMTLQIICRHKKNRVFLMEVKNYIPSYDIFDNILFIHNFFEIAKDDYKQKQKAAE